MKLSTLAAISLLLCAPASAEEAPSRFVPELQAGLNTPSGNLALALDVRALDWLAVNLGGGASFGGFQWSAMTRAELVLSKVSFGLGVGLSGGPWESIVLSRARYDHALWANGALTVGWRTRRQWPMRVSLGYGAILNPQACEWADYSPAVPCDAEFPARFVLPFAQFAVGYPL